MNDSPPPELPSQPTPPPITAYPPPIPEYAYPPLWRNHRQVDTDQLRLLVIFHFVLAGLGVIAIGFLVIHYTIMNSVFIHPAMWQNNKGGPPPEVFFSMFHYLKWFYVLFGGCVVLSMVLTTLAGLYISQRRGRMFSMVVAGLNCLHLPFGTALGVFTLIVLQRPSVVELYREQRDGPAAP